MPTIKATSPSPGTLRHWEQNWSKIQQLKMKYFIIGLLLSGLAISMGFTLYNNNNETVQKLSNISTSRVNSNDKDEIQDLIRQVLNWRDSKNSIDILPALNDSTDKIYIGFDLNIHKANLNKLCATGFFSAEFIENYNQIILTLDKKIKNKEFNDWLVGELPSFSFANDVDPWCLCQDVPYDKPNPWDLVEVEIINLDNEKGDLTWTWGKSDWSKNFKYKFRVSKENGKWKIDYLHGFDFKESIKKDG